MENTLRVGVVGCGVGRAHINSYRKLGNSFEVVAVCDIDGTKASQVAEEYGIPSHYTDYEDLCKREDIDVIDLCTPPYQHYAQILGVLSSGKNVICEKPLVGSLKEVDDLSSAEVRYGRQVMPILQYRYGHGLRKLKMLVDANITGKPYLSTVIMAWRRKAEYYSAPWRGKWDTELGGTLLNHAIHQLDMMCHIVGPVRSVFARTASLVNPIDVEDCGIVSMEMSNGSLASLSATLGSTREISRLRFCFSNLTAESNSHPYANSDDPWTFYGDSEEIDRQVESSIAGFQAEYSSFEEQFTLFHRAIHTGAALPITLSNARTLIELMTAIYESAQTNLPVTLPISNEHPKYMGWAPANSIID